MLFATTDLQVLKEAADRRSMNGGVSDALTGWFEGRAQISVLDLSGGTFSAPYGEDAVRTDEGQHDFRRSGAAAFGEHGMARGKHVPRLRP